MVTPYTGMINALHGQERLDPVRNGVESPIVGLLRKLRELSPDQNSAMQRGAGQAHIPKTMGGMGSKRHALSAALRPKALKVKQPLKAF